MTAGSFVWAASLATSKLEDHEFMRLRTVAIVWSCEGFPLVVPSACRHGSCAWRVAVRCTATCFRRGFQRLWWHCDRYDPGGKLAVVVLRREKQLFAGPVCPGDFSHVSMKLIGLESLDVGSDLSGEREGVPLLCVCMMMDLVHLSHRLSQLRVQSVTAHCYSGCSRAARASMPDRILVLFVCQLWRACDPDSTDPEPAATHATWTEILGPRFKIGDHVVRNERPDSTNNNEETHQYLGA